MFHNTNELSYVIHSVTIYRSLPKQRLRLLICIVRFGNLYYANAFQANPLLPVTVRRCKSIPRERNVGAMAQHLSLSVNNGAKKTN